MVGVLWFLFSSAVPGVWTFPRVTLSRISVSCEMTQLRVLQLRSVDPQAHAPVTHHMQLRMLLH